jgi:hypothetical protein
MSGGALALVPASAPPSLFRLVPGRQHPEANKKHIATDALVMATHAPDVMTTKQVFSLQNRP